MEKNTVKLREAFEQLVDAVFLCRDWPALKEALSEALICRGLYPDMIAGRDDLLLSLNRYYKQTLPPVQIRWISLEVLREQPHLCALFAAFELDYPDGKIACLQLRATLEELPRPVYVRLDLDLPASRVFSPQPQLFTAHPRPFTMAEPALQAEMAGVYLEANMPLFYISSPLLKQLGFTYEEFYAHCRNQLDLILVPDDVGTMKTQCEDAFQHGDEFQMPLRFVRRDRTALWRQCQGYRFLTDQGRIAILLRFADIHAVKERQAELETQIRQLRQRNDEMAMLTDNLPGGICLLQLDDAQTLLYGNRRFYQLLQTSEAEIRQRYQNEWIRMVHPDDRNAVLAQIKEAFTAGLPGLHYQLRVPTKTGILFLMVYASFALTGSVQTINCVVLDITEGKQRELNIAINEQRMTKALEQVGCVLFDYDFKTNQILGTPQACARYNFPDTAVNPEYFIDRGLILPPFGESFLAMIHRLRQGEERVSCIIKNRNQDNIVHWSQLTLVTLPDEFGQTEQAVGIIEDITLQKDAELAYAKEQQYRKAIAAGACLMIEINLCDNLVEKISGDWGFLIDDALRTPYDQFQRRIARQQIHPDDRLTFLSTFSRDALKAAFNQEQREITLQYRRLSEKRQMVWVETTAHIIQDPATQHLKVLFFIRDIDKEKKHELILQYQSQRDSLTGLLNKGSSEAQIQSVLENDPQAMHALLVLDIDEFKKINDTFGHLYGDQVLSRIARQIREVFRGDDVLGRIGGDEFAILMKNCKTEQIVREKAGQLCQKLAALFDDSVSCSIGVSFYAKDGTYFYQLYQNADIALYQSKRQGKNQVQFYLPSMKQESWTVNSTEIDELRTEMPVIAAAPGLEEHLTSQLLEELNDVIYVSDPKTYELLFINRTIKEDLNIIDDYIGKKCYKVLQGRDTPCPFCTNDKLKFNEYYVWEHTNELMNRDFIVKDKLIQWQGRTARMEFAMDIAEHNHLSKELSLQLERGNALLEHVRQIVDADSVSLAIEESLTGIGRYYAAERVVLSFLQETPPVYEWMKTPLPSFKEVWNNLAEVLLEPGYTYFHAHDAYVLVDIDALKSQNAELVRTFLRLGVRSLLAVPLLSQEKIIGCCAIVNPSAQGQDLSFAESLIAFLVSELLKYQAVEQLRFMSYHDPLTGLGNRNRYVEQLQHWQRHPLSQAGVLVCDVNGLKQLNELYGHHYGDQVLIELARILNLHARPEQLFRLGGDEFIAVYENISHAEFQQRLARLKNAFTIIVNGVSMGSSWSGDEPDVSALMNHADQLMYIAKQNYYKTTYNLSKHYRPETYQQLMEALKENRFTVYIQPKADLESGRILGGEALIRYLHPQMGVIPPARFVPVLENEHLIRVIDLFVLDEVCQMQQRRQRQSRNAAVLSLNFSRLTLLEENMALEVEKILSRYDFDPSLIEIEITETVGEIEKETLRTVIQSLKRLHLRISLDDFGTKYTNLSMLTVADFDVLKLDRSLIQGLVDSAQNQIIVASIISMCHQLGVSVIAEGVETEAQRDKLRQLGCSLGQGYFYGKPMPVGDFRTLFNKNWE